MRALVCLAFAGAVMVPAIAQAQEACQGATYEAETMVHSTGGPATNGWNIWSNGYISTNHNFDGRSKVITVIARGQAAGGESAHMTVTIGGKLVYFYSILPTGFTAYSFNYDTAAGTEEIRVEFDNDFNQGGQDRNLFIDKVIVGCGGGWTNLTLLNGWKPAANSNVPAVGLVDGIVTFRGALDGSQATSDTPFCLSDSHVLPGPDYTQYRSADVGFMTLRSALANGVSGSLMLPIGPHQAADPGNPPVPDIEVSDSYCMQVTEHGQSSAPGPNARALTSLEGVTYTKSARSVPQNATKVELDGIWGLNYPWRGTDGGVAGLPNGQGIYAKVVNGFVRFQGSLNTTANPSDDPVLFTLPPGQGLIPGNPVYVPVSLGLPGGAQAGHIVIQPNGDVVVEGPIAQGQSVALDGTAYSLSSPPSAVAIPLSSGWIASSSRAVRARVANGVVRLEGAVKNGTTDSIGTLPAGMRPAQSIFVVADAIQFAQPSTLRIDSDGTIHVVSPALVAAQPGISLDGVSFVVDGPFQCTGGCLSATPIARNQNSGPFNTTGERWFVVSESINGWQASEMAGRTIRVNGVLVTAGQMPLPPTTNGSYYFQFTGSASAHTWASWSFW